jgi:HEAT repeat protein
VRSKAKSMSDQEQSRVVQQLTQTLTQDTCPAVRAEIVRTLAAVPSPTATESLRLALQDKDSSVRTVACHALGKRQESEAIQALGLVVAQDPDGDVRMAATKELGRFKNQEAVHALAAALDDNDPALQHLAVQSLRSVTGKDFGDSVPAWRQFVRGEQVKPGEAPSLAEKLRRLF